MAPELDDDEDDDSLSVDDAPAGSRCGLLPCMKKKADDPNKPPLVAPDAAPNKSPPDSAMRTVQNPFSENCFSTNALSQNGYG